MLYTLRSGGTSHPETSVLQHLTDALVTAGVLSIVNGDFLCEEQAVPDLTVLVNEGRAYIQGTNTNAYPVRSDATESAVITPNASGNPRIDAIVLYIDLAASPNAESSNVATLVVVPGTPAASPIAPTNVDISTSIGASNPFLRLANVDVASGATSILNADITDTRAEAVFTGSGSGGSVSLVANETPAGAVDGSNALFTTSAGYVAGSLAVYRDGQRMEGGGADYTETVPASGTFTFVTAPLIGSVITVDYKSAASSTSNADTVDGYDANATPTVGNLLPLNSVGQFPLSAMPLPQGYMSNGMIDVSLSGSDLVVALKGLNGNDPSASNPVYVRINDTVHEITSALSHTLAAGTNWFNAGSTQLATKEIDLFVYLGFNSTDGVVIGISRICHVKKYSGFNTTNTEDHYCAISDITNAAADDNYEVVGRFAATLSAGAAYTWTIPTFTADNLIQRPIYESRILYWTAVYTGFSVNPPAGLVTCYQIISDKCKVFFHENGYGTSNAVTFTMKNPIKGTSLFDQWDENAFGADNGGLAQRLTIILTSSLDTFSFGSNGGGAIVNWTAAGVKGMTYFNMTYFL